MKTEEINKALECRRIDDLIFKDKKTGILYGCRRDDFALYVEGLGYFSFDDACMPYCPIGGRKAINDIIKGGGMLNYDGAFFIKPYCTIGEYIHMKTNKQL